MPTHNPQSPNQRSGKTGAKSTEPRQASGRGSTARSGKQDKSSSGRKKPH